MINKQIPADMVVNAILVAMVAHANHPNDTIYHIGSSVRNPLRNGNLQDYGFRYFTAKPWINKEGKPVKVRKCTVLSNMDSFHRYMFIHYLLLLKVPIYLANYSPLHSDYCHVMMTLTSSNKASSI